MIHSSKLHSFSVKYSCRAKVASVTLHSRPGPAKSALDDLPSIPFVASRTSAHPLLLSACPKEPETSVLGLHQHKCLWSRESPHLLGSYPSGSFSLLFCATLQSWVPVHVCSRHSYPPSEAIARFANFWPEKARPSALIVFSTPKDLLLARRRWTERYRRSPNVSPLMGPTLRSSRS